MKANYDLPDLPEAQIEALRALSTHGPMTSGGLATQLRLARSTISNLITAMERAHLIDRSLNSTGSRILLTPSAHAKLILARWDEAADECIENAVRLLTRQQQDTLAGAIPILQDLVGHLDAQTNTARA